MDNRFCGNRVFRRAIKGHHKLSHINWIRCDWKLYAQEENWIPSVIVSWYRIGFSNNVQRSATVHNCSWPRRSTGGKHSTRRLFFRRNAIKCRRKTEATFTYFPGWQKANESIFQSCRITKNFAIYLETKSFTRSSCVSLRRAKIWLIYDETAVAWRWRRQIVV